jgi:hypothetical protein
MRLLAGDFRAWVVGVVLSALLAQLLGPAVETCPGSSPLKVSHDGPDVPDFGSVESPLAPGPLSVGAGARYELVRFVWAPDGTLAFVEAIVVRPPPYTPSAPLPSGTAPPDVLPPPS